MTPSEQSARCIWMDAGVIGYKLCDREFHCDQCRFDAIMRSPVFENGKGFEEHSGPRAPSTLAEHLDRFFSAFDPLQFPGDRVYLPGHLWIRTATDSTATVGIDHVAASLVTPLAGIALPQHPSHVVRNSPFCWLIHHEGTISIGSPVDAEVISYNQRLLSEPDILGDKPYTQGWILKVSLPYLVHESTHRSASEHSALVAGELVKLKDDVAQHLQARPEIGPSALDGGIPLHSPFEMIGPSSIALLARLFIP